jgi:hypothetical protein
MRSRGRELRALLNGWDPISIVGDRRPDDEYDCLLWPLMRLLEGGATARDLMHYLEQELTEHFGLSAAPQGSLQFAERVKRWYEGSWAGTRAVGTGPDDGR